MHHEKFESGLQELIILSFMCAYNSSIFVEKCKTKQENLTSSINIKDPSIILTFWVEQRCTFFILHVSRFTNTI